MSVKNFWNFKPIDENFIIENNELHIWRAKISEDMNNLSYYWKLLTQNEQDQARLFYFLRDRKRYIVTRAILRKLLMIYLENVKCENILFKQTEYGKPYLVDGINTQDIKFNLSHSRDCIVYAFTKNIEVGIDIEYINNNFAMEDIIKYCGSEQEQIQLQKLTNDYKYCYFYKLWVVKEALVKAMGLGLSFDLKQININFNKNNLICAVDNTNNTKLHWTVSLFSAYNGYYSAFATKKPVKKALFFDFIEAN